MAILIALVQMCQGTKDKIFVLIVDIVWVSLFRNALETEIS